MAEDGEVSSSGKNTDVVNIMWKPADDTSMRARILPMISSALTRTPLMGMEIIAWDCMCVPTPNAVLVGVAVAIRGFDLAGPGKELMQFRSFSTWRPEQAEVDKVVAATVEGLRLARSQQVNGN